MASLVFVLTFALLGGIWVASSRARSSARQEKASGRWKVKKILGRKLGGKPPDELSSGERVIDDQIPRHLPLKIEFENLDVEPLLTNWEIKVTNTSDKPIYFLELLVALPEVPNSSGQQFMFPLRYGRMGLIDFEEPVRPEDVPLLPGESHVFKTPEDYLPNLKERHSGVRRVFLFFQEINFGDKTGFTTTGGLPVPNTRKARSACPDGNRGDPEISLTILQASYSSDTSPQHSFGFLPLIKISGSVSRRPPQSNLCCPGSTCSFSKESKYTCYCGEGRTTAVTGCEDPLGQCADVYQLNKTCPDGGGGQLTCPEFFRGVCAAYCDRDNDQWYSTSCGGLDCNDNDPKITPLSPECKPSPSPSPPPSPIVGSCSQTLARRCLITGGCWMSSKCECDENCNTPVLIDTLGDGFSLTDPEHGVNFDLDGVNAAERRAWTAATSDDAWLALDRNGNGRVDNGAELFGNRTPQPEAENPNGFLALAEYDKAESGGNGDGVVDSQDAIFSSLRLWRDTNHNGVSEAGELHTLVSLDVASIFLDYKESRRADEYGNEFRYRAKVGEAKHSRVGRWAWDVFLVSAP